MRKLLVMHNLKNREIEIRASNLTVGPQITFVQEIQSDHRTDSDPRGDPIGFYLISDKSMKFYRHPATKQHSDPQCWNPMRS